MTTLRRLWSSSSAVHVARSLKDVARGTKVHSLLLQDSQDLICKNLMCEHVGLSCTCKLSLVLERLPELKELDLSNNQLRQLSERAFELTTLEVLNLSRNHLRSISPNIGALKQLKVLDLRMNQLEDLPVDALASLPNLQTVYVDGNLLSEKTLRHPELVSKLTPSATSEKH